ncbi:CBO0543 family protein [Bacillus sp. 31A1R]|uniref:CBO0543 family protein n=1 Tax=Robertmurraya mangrovi TaxID=3098077 RepID=A0ABU5J4Z3_9BACI|nr:CBO0543 family protein [Bacillus sp. 31A1R]MDZ5474486.1 CBO0543 family protein [Bacillus sp. 31A1R]
MNILVAILLLAASFIWGNWSRWRELLPTFYYLSFMNLFYEFIGNEYKHLWKLESNITNEFLTICIYNFIVYPCIIVLFFGNLPTEKAKTIISLIKWIIVSVIIEYIALKLGYIKYLNGWNVYWTCFFWATMYPMLILHNRKPLAAIGLSFVFIAFYLYIFDYHIFTKA